MNFAMNIVQIEVIPNEWLDWGDEFVEEDSFEDVQIVEQVEIDVPQLQLPPLNYRQLYEIAVFETDFARMFYSASSLYNKLRDEVAVGQRSYNLVMTELTFKQNSYITGLVRAIRPSEEVLLQLQKSSNSLQNFSDNVVDTDSSYVNVLPFVLVISTLAATCIYKHNNSDFTKLKEDYIKLVTDHETLSKAYDNSKLTLLDRSLEIEMLLLKINNLENLTIYDHLSRTFWKLFFA